MNVRLAEIAPEAFSDLQREVAAEAAAGPRGRMPAPMRAWIASPELARRSSRLGEFLRYGTQLPPRLSELAILVTARFWTSQYEWYIHARAAEEAGLDPAIIAAIAAKETPVFTEEDAAVIYEVSQILHHARDLPDALQIRARAVLGETAFVELIGLLGYYTLVSMTLNVFGITPPPGVPDPLSP